MHAARARIKHTQHACMHASQQASKHASVQRTHATVESKKQQRVYSRRTTCFCMASTRTFIASAAGPRKLRVCIRQRPDIGASPTARVEAAKLAAALVDRGATVVAAARFKARGRAVAGKWCVVMKRQCCKGAASRHVGACCSGAESGRMGCQTEAHATACMDGLIEYQRLVTVAGWPSSTLVGGDGRLPHMAGRM